MIKALRPSLVLSVLALFLASGIAWGDAPNVPLTTPYWTGQATAKTLSAKGTTVQVPLLASPPARPEPEDDEQAPRAIPPYPWTPQAGPTIQAPAGPQSAPGTSVAPVQSLAGPSPLAPTDFSFFMNTAMVTGGSRSDRTPEPGMGMHDQLSFTTGNWYATLSKDAGHTMSYLDPYSAFPSANGGFCCDQVALYEPTHDLMVWLLQYDADSAGSTLRLAVAHGLNAQTNAVWTYWDLTPQAIGYAAGNWYDFNDLGITNNRLYLTTNARTGGVADSFIAAVVYSISLDELVAGGTINYSYFTDASVGAYHCAWGVSTTMYFLSHPSSSAVRFAQWTEGSGSIPLTDTAVAAFQNGGGTCPDPNGWNWCGFSDSRIGSAWRTPYNGGEIIAMWNSAQHDSFPYPYVQVATFRESDFALLANNFIWSSAFAWYYTGAGTNWRGDAAGNINYGGGGNFAHGAVWVWDDVNSHVIQPLENYLAVNGTASPSKHRWGDFYNTRKHSRYTGSWVTVSHADTTTYGAEPHFLWMGRSRDLPTYPANDSCASASLVTLTSGSTVTRFDDNSYAVFSVSDPAVCRSVSRTLWYRFTAPASGSVTIDTSGSVKDTVLAVWHAASCPGGAPLACDDDSGTGTTSKITDLPVTSGQTYYVMVGSYDGAGYESGQYYGGFLQIAFSMRSCTSAPTVTAPVSARVTQTTCM